jgi:hypothetical protein
MRKTLKLAVLAFLVAAIVAPRTGNTAQVTLPQPTASYDATVTFDSGSSHYVSTVNAAGPNERRSATINGGEQTVLINRATGVITLLVPTLNTAMVLDNGSATGYGIAGLNRLPVTVEGQDTISGVPATRYAVSAQNARGSFNGRVWATQDGILMQIDGTVIHDGKTTPVRAVTSNLHRRPQPPALFVVSNGIKPMGVDILGMLKSAKSVPVSTQ